jgi:hypothetical protein
MLKLAGQVTVIVCDHCCLPCEQEVYEYSHYQIGKERAAVTQHFCSRACQDEHAGIQERVTQAIDRGLRAEVKLVYRGVCPKCTERLRKFYEREEL